ncbi:hypothetical protein BJ741DRAFT_607740, partial [Chytriomyces cf. hyalinus JEL632]
MAQCPSRCACCLRHAVHIHSLHQRAINELNLYRKLLQMDPLTSVDESFADHAIVKPTPYLGSSPCSAAFQTMPVEILEHIVQYVGADSILPLCHALPNYKHVSTAMFDFANRFPNEKYTPSKLWPDMYFPKFKNTETNMTEFPIQHMHAVGAYARIISKHGGNVFVPCSKNVFNYLGALPDVLSVFPGDINTCSGWADFLRQLADASKRIRSCIVGDVQAYDIWAEVAHQLTRLPIQSLIWRDELPVIVQETLPRISGLRHLQVDRPIDVRENNSLSRCLHLEELSFARLMFFETAVGLVGRILRRIKGSRIRKVWCEKLSQDDRVNLTAWEMISSDFLEHGWRKEGGRTIDDRV